MIQRVGVFWYGQSHFAVVADSKTINRKMCMYVAVL